MHRMYLMRKMRAGMLRGARYMIHDDCVQSKHAYRPKNYNLLVLYLILDIDPACYSHYQFLNICVIDICSYWEFCTRSTYTVSNQSQNTRKSLFCFFWRWLLLISLRKLRKKKKRKEKERRAYLWYQKLFSPFPHPGTQPYLRLMTFAFLLCGLVACRTREPAPTVTGRLSVPSCSLTCCSCPQLMLAGNRVWPLPWSGLVSLSQILVLACWPVSFYRIDTV